MEEINYLGFSGVPYEFRGLFYVDACDMADQIIVASGSTEDELYEDLKNNVDGFYNMIL